MMKFATLGAGILSATLLAAGAASAATVVVDGLSGPYDPLVAGNFDYGVHDQLAPASIAVAAGTTVTVTYISGLTSAFGGAPVVDANGYVGSVFGTGLGESQTGSSGTFFPSFPISGALGTPIYLNALLGAFVDSSGVVLSEFAPGDGPYTILAPSGTVALLFGVNDDIFSDNTGALTIGVTGLPGVPEPAAWTLMIGGLGVTGAALRRRRRLAALA
jgi:hypothetical protein